MTSARDLPHSQCCTENATGSGPLVDQPVRPHAHHAFDHPLNALDSLAVSVGVHLDRLGVQRSDWQRVAKVGEEGGEVVGALLKRAEGRADTAHLLAELGDVFLAALAAADQLGVTPSAIIAARWADVSQRSPERNSQT